MGRGYHRVTPAVEDEIWARLRAGYAAKPTARALGLSTSGVHGYLVRCGGIRPAARRRSTGRLSLLEREEISRGLAAGWSLRTIAAGLGRAPSTVSREVGGHGGRSRYRAARADEQAWARARRPQTCKLASRPLLRDIVAEKLRQRWSPQQIAGWLKATYPDEPEMQVSHETIYRTLFIQSRGALRKELTAYLRTKRVLRRSAGIRLPDGRGGRPGILNISERPAEAEDRAVPGHWEGDLVFGKGMTPVATLVERSTRFVMLVALPNGHKADLVADALAAKITNLPAALTRTLTWDQGHEMSEHAKFTQATGVEVYFCDPKSPWQRGSNENTNGLLRQYLPRTLDFRTLTQADFDAIADELNGRPRQTLGFKTPSQALAEVLR
ncbi:IS30 family transposase [Nocardioides ungokensis]|uniref:IS30 family transposase n=1 Tax=Nocardioides ungokensis TaxID=1643322 RepID=UPI001FE5BEF6|nr:IS30 family transposase [Nocardioides ungokensis]